jgi:Tfp pilus assembly major pilin PilA
MKGKQSGMTLIGFILVLGVVGVFVYMGMKLIPMYSEYYAVKQALNGLASEPGVAEKDPAKLKDLFFRRLYISYADNIKSENVKVTRKEAGWMMTVDYEVRKPLIANLDVVGVFHAEKELSRRSGIE